MDRITSTFGVIVSDVDLATPLSEADFATIRDLLYEHSMLLFRNQSLTPAQKVLFAKRFGAKLYTPSDAELVHPTESTIAVLSNIVEQGKPIGMQNVVGIEWHTDGSASDADGDYAPNVVTMLSCVETPPVGGDTLFAGTYPSCCDLPESLRRRLVGKVAIYNLAKLMSNLAFADTTTDDQLANVTKQSFTHEARSQHPDVRLPLIREHPVTGQEALVVTPEELVQIEGMSEEDSYRLACELIEYATQPQYVYRHKWQPGDVVVWDNFSMLHSTTAYTYQRSRRLMHRLIVFSYDTPAWVRNDGRNALYPG